MRILYVAKHGSGGNDDEGAIAYALQQLGHEVNCQPESDPDLKVGSCDFLLFHKWDDEASLRQIECPKVFWYFDLVCTLHESIRKRQEKRQDWIRRITPLVDLGFCTDGDWAAQDKTGKLSVLRQGADERIVGCGNSLTDCPASPILFTGNSNGGDARRSFVSEMFERYPSQFLCVRDGVYRERLRDLIARSIVYVCPDFPVTDHYWSNRIYNAAGFGACIVHPYCDVLLKEYGGGCLEYYGTRTELHAAIDYLLRSPEVRARLQENARTVTVERHLYRHRCEQLINTVKERLGI